MPSTAIRQEIIAKALKIVVKVGTNALTDETGRLDRAVVESLVDQIAAVMKTGIGVTLVASGAIGAGIAELNLPARPTELDMLQAAAAVGQGRLMRIFQDAFGVHCVKVAQVLLTRDDFEHRGRYLSIRKTLSALGRCGALAILNENDAVGGRLACFGDNDIIAALVANMIRADLLVLLSVVDGVLKDGQPLDVIQQVDPASLTLAGAYRSKLGSGGMGTKMTAAGMVTAAGEVAIVANARTPDVLRRILAGEKLGTVFLPALRKMSSRRRWIGQASRPAGKIMIDDGAARALGQGGKSLLPSGIQAVSGTFRRGATVAIIDATGRQIARGLTNYSSEQIDRIKGLKSAQIAKALGEKPYDEVVHRNNMMLG